MEIKAKYSARELKFAAKTQGRITCGGDIGALLELIEKEKNIRKIEISGETKSYTFTRQIYLLANMLKELSGATVVIDGRALKEGETVCPSY